VLAIEQAQKKVLRAVRCLPAERVALQDALGRVSASDVFSAEELVPFARSAMDGFAVRSADTVGASPESNVKLNIAGSAYAEAGKSKLAPKTAIAISTGAPVPIGADAVVPIENVSVLGNTIEISKRIAAGDCVFPAGEDVKRGERIIARGEVLRAGEIALLAFAGNARVHVYRRPRVNILATGNELVEIGAKPRHGQIRNSNALLLCSLAREIGAVARFVGVAPDDPAKLKKMLRSARRGADVIVTTGGASRGERDYLKAAFAELGAEILINQVAMRPGRPMGFAMWRGIPACILPGNPAAAFVCWQLFVRAAVTLMAGRSEPLPARVTARLTGRIHGRSGVEYAAFARARFRDAGLEVEPLENQCSSLVRTAAQANALAFVPPGKNELRAGDLVEVQLLGGDVAAK
jgi:molybdopterin molybdotransferase